MLEHSDKHPDRLCGAPELISDHRRRDDVHGSLKTLGLVAIAGALVIVAVRNGGAMAGLDDHQQLSLLYRLGLLILVASGLARMFKGRYGEAARMTVIWAGVVLALAVGYTYRFELKDGANRVLSELVPGHAAARGRTVELARTGAGDFHISTQVNGARVPMVLDTGASTVMLTHEAAVAAHLPMEMIKYTVNIDTANGRTYAAAATLDRIAIGGIVERSVPALIAQPGTLKTSLLGMSFLSRLQGWEVRGDKVVMRGAAGTSNN
jgi:aspartyl protease family protein